MKIAKDVGSENDAVSRFDCEIPALEDPWIASSLLQKSIRRAETKFAERAATALFRLRGPSIWRRLITVAVEDVGIACCETLIEVSAIGSDRALRRTLGGDEDAARYLARRLATAPKCRAADLLASAVCYHPALDTIRHQVQNLTPQKRIDWLTDASRSFHERAVATWFASGIAPNHKPYGTGDLRSLLTVFEEIGAPHTMLEAVARAATRTREPFCALLPLLWLEAQSGPEPPRTVQCPLPPTRAVGGLPLWVLDFHTRAGRGSIQRFIREKEEIRRILQESVGNNRHTEAAYLGAFYADAACCAVSLHWSLKGELEQLGMEADFARAGVPPECVGRIVSAFERHVGNLDDVREDVLSRYLESA